MEGSLDRLGLERIELLYLHDPENITFDEGTAPGGPLEALIEMKRQGVIGSLGVAGGPVGLMSRYVRTGVFDVLITHNRWSLVDRSANELLDEAADLGVAVVNGAPFGGGILGRELQRGGREWHVCSAAGIRRRLEAGTHRRDR